MKNKSFEKMLLVLSIITLLAVVSNCQQTHLGADVGVMFGDKEDLAVSPFIRYATYDGCFNWQVGARLDYLIDHRQFNQVFEFQANMDILCKGIYLGMVLDNPQTFFIGDIKEFAGGVQVYYSKDFFSTGVKALRTGRNTNQAIFYFRLNFKNY